MSRRGIRPAINPIDAARMTIMVRDARLATARKDGRCWSQEDLAEELGIYLNRDVGRHEAQWLESSSTRPFGRQRHRELWDAACGVLGLDRSEINRLAGGV